MKKKDNKLYEIVTDTFERRLRYLVTTALIADITAALMLAAAIVLLSITLLTPRESEPEIVYIKEETGIEETETEEEEDPEPTPQPEVQNQADQVEIEQPQEALPASAEEIELLALVTMAEAEGESVEGKRLVIDTVLNRVDSPRWPNTIREVIYQPSQFVAMSNGRAERCVVTDEVRQLVVEELLSRTNNEVVYFTAGGYGRYGTPVFQVGNHYFCK